MSKLIKVYIVDAQIIALQLMHKRKLLSFGYQKMKLRELKESYKLDEYICHTYTLP